MKYTLYIYVNDDNDSVKELYKIHVENHNNKIAQSNYPDSGFDLYNLKPDNISHGETYTMDTKIVCAAYKKHPSSDEQIPTAFYLYPRSSISKTPLRLANSVGIIDSGYRGNIIAKLDNNGNHKTGYYAHDFNIGYKDKFVQICMPDLSEFQVKIMDSMDNSIFGITERGSGGFGSTNV